MVENILCAPPARVNPKTRRVVSGEEASRRPRLVVCFLVGLDEKDETKPTAEMRRRALKSWQFIFAEFCFSFFELTIENAVLARIIATVTKQLFDEIGRVDYYIECGLGKNRNSTHELQLVYGCSEPRTQFLMVENLETRRRQMTHRSSKQGYDFDSKISSL